MAIACPICASNVPNHSQYGTDGDSLKCPRCGTYKILGSASAMWKANNPTERQVANASGWLREHPNVVINSNDISNLLVVTPPSVADRAMKLLLLMEQKITDLGTYLTINANSTDIREWLGASYSINENELRYLFNTFLISEMGFVSSPDRPVGIILYNGQISPKGYAYLNSLRHNPTLSQIGFCAMWFDENVLPVWTDAISPAILDAGYEAKRIDTHQHNNKIDDEIIVMIRRSKFVVADFTGQRGGVYFESGFALGLGLPVIWACEKSQLKEVHFDNRQYNFLQWEKEKLPEFRKALQSRIEATLGRGTFS